MKLFRIKNSEVYSASVLILSLSALIQNIAATLPFSYFPQYATSLGAQIWFVGIFLAAFLITNSLFSSFFGSLSDRVGRKKIIIGGLLADAFLGILTGLISNWESLLIIRALNGIAIAAINPVARASLIDHVPKKRSGEILGFFLMASMVGWFLGPVFGGTIQFFSETFFGLTLENSYRIPYFVDSLLSVIVVVLVAWKVRETRGISSIKKKVDAIKEKDIKPAEWISRSIKVLYITSLANGFSVGFIAPVSVLFLSSVFFASSFEIGTILSVSGLVGVAFNLFAGKLADKWGKKPLIAIGSISSRLAAIGLPFSSNLLHVTGAMIFRNLGINVSMPASRALEADLVPEKVRGKLFGRLEASFQFGMVIGSILGPLLFVAYQFETFIVGGLLIRGAGLPFFVSAIFGLLSLILLLIFVEEPAKHLEKTKITIGSDVTSESIKS